MDPTGCRFQFSKLSDRSALQWIGEMGFLSVGEFHVLALRRR